MSENKLKPFIEKPLSGKTDQNFNFWYNPDYWKESSTTKRKPKKCTSKELAEELGYEGGKEAILDSVYRGEPPIYNIPVTGEIQLRLNY